MEGGKDVKIEERELKLRFAREEKNIWNRVEEEEVKRRMKKGNKGNEEGR